MAVVARKSRARKVRKYVCQYVFLVFAGGGERRTLEYEGGTGFAEPKSGSVLE